MYIYITSIWIIRGYSLYNIIQYLFYLYIDREALLKNIIYSYSTYEQHKILSFSFFSDEPSLDRHSTVCGFPGLPGFWYKMMLLRHFTPYNKFFRRYLFINIIDIYLIYVKVVYVYWYR